MDQNMFTLKSLTMTSWIVDRRLLHNTEVWLVFKNDRYNSSYSYLSTVDAEKIVLIHNRLAI
jgi:hypothetical protein